MFERLKVFVELGQAFALPAWDAAYFPSWDRVHCSANVVVVLTLA